MTQTHWTTDFSTALRIALRARFYALSLWLLAALALVALLAAQFSGRQPATVALDVGLSAIRIALPIVVVLLVQELFAREFDRRYILSSLTYPRPREQMLLGRFAAAYALLLALLGAMALLLMALVWFAGQGYTQGTPVALDHRYLLTLAFIALEQFSVLAVGTLLAVVASTPSFILIGTLAFVVTARSFSTIIILLTQQGTLVSNPESYREALGILTYLLPDLGILDIRGTALYGSLIFIPEDWPLRLLSIITYSVMLLGLALWALRRKRFS